MLPDLVFAIELVFIGGPPDIYCIIYSHAQRTHQTILIDLDILYSHLSTLSVCGVGCFYHWATFLISRAKWNNLNQFGFFFFVCYFMSLFFFSLVCMYVLFLSFILAVFFCWKKKKIMFFPLIPQEFHELCASEHTRVIWQWRRRRIAQKFSVTMP